MAAKSSREFQIDEPLDEDQDESGSFRSMNHLTRRLSSSGDYHGHKLLAGKGADRRVVTPTQHLPPSAVIHSTKQDHAGCKLSSQDAVHGKRFNAHAMHAALHMQSNLSACFQLALPSHQLAIPPSAWNAARTLGSASGPPFFTVPFVCDNFFNPARKKELLRKKLVRAEITLWPTYQ